MGVDYSDATIDATVEALFSSQVDFLLELASTPSANPGYGKKSVPGEAVELGMADVLQKHLEAAGVAVERFVKAEGRPNIIGVFGPHRSRKNLIFHAHMDTPTPGSGFRGDPYSPFVRNEKLYGLGIMHMKASLSAMVYAAQTLHELGLNLGGKLVLQFSVDELSLNGAENGVDALLKKGIKARGAIVGAPGHAIGVGHRGDYRFKLRTFGESIETTSLLWQRKERGKNAIVEMARAIEALQAFELPFKGAKVFPAKKPVFSFPTLIEGGDDMEMIPELCEAIGDVRLMPGNSDRQVRLRMEELLTEVEGLQYEIEDMLYVPAVEVDVKEEVVELFGEEWGLVSGEVPVFEGISGWNSGYKFVQKDIPTVMQVPLEGGRYRGNQEWVTLASLKALTKTLARTAVRFLGVKQT